MLGNVIGNYKIIKELGSGGMGTVYLAEHTTIGTQVAIKSLHNHLIKNPNIRSRFLKEAKTQAILDHKYITKVIDFIDNEQGLFIVLEYINGVPLDEYLFQNKGLIPEKEAVNYMVKILEAVAYAHQKTIIHRDLKSANIMITPDKSVKIMDFGIAKLTGETLKLTKAGSKLGSPLYMSPEQVSGAEVDTRSDIYSLGVVLHEMLTGKPVYDQHNTTEFEIYDKIIRQPLPRLNTFYSLISNHAQDVVDRATAKLPIARYQTCEEFIADLKNEIPNTTVKKENKPINNTKKTNLIWWIGIPVFILLLFTGIYTFYYNNAEKKFQLIQQKISENNLKSAYQDLQNESYFGFQKKSEELKSDIEKASLTAESNYIKNLTQEILQIDDINKLDFSNFLIQNDLYAYKNELLKLKKSPDIIFGQKIDAEIEKIDAVFTYFKAKELKDTGDLQAAYDEIVSIPTTVTLQPIQDLKTEIEQKIPKKNNLDTSAVSDKLIYAYQSVDEPPQLLNCTNGNALQKYDCIKNNLIKIVNQNLTENIWNNFDVKKNEIWVNYSFVVTDMGNITNLKFDTPNQYLQNYLNTIFNAVLKKTNPATHQSKEVSVLFESKLNLVKKVKDKNEINQPETVKKENEIQVPKIIPSNISIQMADKAPVFPGCGGLEGTELTKCTTGKINRHIAENLRQENLQDKGIATGDYKIPISFKINSLGNVEQINIQTSEPLIEAEVKRAIQTLPPMVPAIYEDMQVTVSYKLILNVNISRE